MKQEDLSSLLHCPIKMKKNTKLTAILSETDFNIMNKRLKENILLRLKGHSYSIYAKLAQIGLDFLTVDDVQIIPYSPEEYFRLKNEIPIIDEDKTCQTAMYCKKEISEIYFLGSAKE